MKRWDILNKLIEENDYKDYLEIGVRPKGNFKRINCKNKEGVDSNKPVKYQMTSDKFFSKVNKKYDLIFIDGLHIDKQCQKDVKNSLEHLKEGGTIVMHDCNPKNKKAQMVPQKQKCWNGDVWKTFVRLRCTNPNLEMFTINADHGCGIIKRGKQELYKKAPLEKCLTWEYFKDNKKELLLLKDSL